jgi:hypothetical protein
MAVPAITLPINVLSAPMQSHCTKNPEDIGWLASFQKHHCATGTSREGSSDIEDKYGVWPEREIDNRIGQSYA